MKASVAAAPNVDNAAVEATPRTYIYPIPLEKILCLCPRIVCIDFIEWPKLLLTLLRSLK